MLRQDGNARYQSANRDLGYVPAVVAGADDVVLFLRSRQKQSHR